MAGNFGCMKSLLISGTCCEAYFLLLDTKLTAFDTHNWFTGIYNFITAGTIRKDWKCASYMLFESLKSFRIIVIDKMVGPSHLLPYGLYIHSNCDLQYWIIYTNYVLMSATL